jgi:4-amino-4-deoxy-L-arabinose transferase-like glycosyltransferase
MFNTFSKKYLILLLIVLLGAGLRFIQLDKYPVQLNHDEISQLYDLSAIVQTQKDIYGNFLPLAFPSTGDYKVGHYIYLSVIPYLLFGYREITIRIAAAFFGSLTVLASFFFVFYLTKNKRISLLSAAALAITPSEIFYSRKSFEYIVGEFFVFLGFSLLLTPSKKLAIKLGGLISLAVGMYFYTALTIVVPLMLLAFLMIYWKNFFTRKQLIFSTTFFIILVIPLVSLSIFNKDIRFRAKTVFFTQDTTFGNELVLQSGQQNELVYLKTVGDFVFNRYLNQLKPEYLFMSGLNLTNQGPIGMGPLLLIQLPLVFLGLIYLIRKEKLKVFLLIITFTAIAFIPSAITYEPVSPHRSVMAFSLISIISAFGLYYLIVLAAIWRRYLRLSALLIFLSLLILNLVYFYQIYTVSYAYEKSEHLHYPYKDVAQYAWSKFKDYDHIIIDTQYGEVAPELAVAAHYYLAYYGKVPPAQFQKGLKLEKEGIRYDKFLIKKIDWLTEKKYNKTLLIASPWSVPLDMIKKNQPDCIKTSFTMCNFQIIDTFNFYDHSPAFYAIELK